MMYLARREQGRSMQVYPVDMTTSPSRAWKFDPILGEGCGSKMWSAEQLQNGACPPRYRQSLLSLPGVAALDRTATGAMLLVEQAERSSLLEPTSEESVEYRQLQEKYKDGT